MKFNKIMIMGVLMIAMATMLVACNSMENSRNRDDSSESLLEKQVNSLEVDLDDDLTDEEIEGKRSQAVVEEEELMENVPVFDLSTEEVQQIIDILEVSSFEYRVIQPRAGTANEVIISMDTDNPLANDTMMDEFEEVITLVLAVFGIDEYPRETIEGMMKTVLETEAVYDFVPYTDTLTLQFDSWNNQSDFTIYLH